MNTEIIVNLASAVTVIGFIYAIHRNFKTDMNARMDKIEKDIREDVKAQNKHVEALSQRMDAQAHRMDAQAQRTDRLYEMFVDLLKEKK